MSEPKNDLAKYIAEESIKLLLHLDSRKMLNNKVVSRFISAFTEEVVTRILRSADASSVPDSEKYKIVSKNFQDLKHEFQESIAAGFANAMTKLVGKKVEYYCVVTVVPESKNTLPC